MCWARISGTVGGGDFTGGPIRVTGRAGCPMRRAPAPTTSSATSTAASCATRC
jgi:hypothetical protein